MTARPRPRSSSLSLIVLCFLMASSLLAPQAWSQTCDRNGCGRAACATPAKPVPSTLWGDLQPAETSIPAERDATSFDEFKEFYSQKNWYFGVDASNGFLFTALSHGIQIWDIASSPGSPRMLSQAKESGTGSLLPVWTDSAEIKWPLLDVDVPDGTDDAAAVVGVGGIGLVVFDTSSKSQPRVAYQSHHKDAYDVYATRIGNTSYAFAATSQGLLVYNMTAARQLNRCAEGSPAGGESTNCSGVLIGKVGNRTDAKYVSGAGNLLAVSFGSSFGVEIWDVSNPASPQRVVQGLSSDGVYGTAMWKEGNGTYLALRTWNQGRIYDVSCAASGGCGGLTPLWTQAMDSGTVNFFVTFSRSNGVPFLYFGSDNRCGGSTQREWLMDVSSPSAPHDITPPARLVNGVQTGYWGWYYRGNSTGFNLIMPRTGVFSGDFFYRAGLAIMDIHKRTGGSPPVVDFEFSPLEVYAGSAVNFLDRSSGVPTSWSWSFGNTASPAIATVQNPSGITFSQVGTASVSLTASNGIGSGSRTKTVTVLDPAPAVGSVTVSPASPTVCQPLTFTATGVTGRPTLSYTWDVKNASTGFTQPITNSNTGTQTWSTAGILPGIYTATVTVGNGVGSASKAVTFTLADLGQLPATGAFNVTNDAFTAGTVKFHVVAPGATEWNWDFGDGFTGWTNDPVTGPNPTHSYTSTGTKSVRVKVKNCNVPVGAERESAPLSINITQVTPLTASFQASGIFCSGFGCVVNTNQSITFIDSSTGAELWDFDWNGDGDFTDSTDQLGLTASAFTVSGGDRTITHTYTTAGDFAPRLRVRRGASEEATATHRTITVGTSSGNPGGGGGGTSISVSCIPASVEVGGSTTCTATASGCTPSTNGWSWSTSGGTASGGAASVIGVSWSSAGSKAVTATNANCGTASGSAGVVVNQAGGGGNPGGGGGGTLAANFTFTPPAPSPGQAVTFNGASSTGSPSEFAWSFGDNTTATGSTVSHTYAQAGTYLVRLTVTKPGTGSNCFFGVCAAETTKTVVVGTGGGGGGTNPPSAEFTPDNASCINQFGFNQCQASAGTAVTLTANEADANTYAWSFGDNTTGTGRSVTHTWAQGEYQVTLTVTKNGLTSTQSRTFIVNPGNGNPNQPGLKSVVLPWIAQTRGALDQASDLYIHNPGTAAMDVTIEFRKRGTPEANPPRVTKTIAAGATLFVADALDELFNRENVAGFITVSVEGTVEPVITSFNSTIQEDGSRFGQTVPGLSMSRAATGAATKASTPQVHHLIGLNDNSDRLAYFGVSNPTETGATYQLRFFDHLGRAIGQSKEFTLARYGQRQFQVKEIRDLFGVTDEDDYRIEISNQDGVQLYPYAANLRIASDDPSFVNVGSSNHSKVYLVGALSSKGINNSTWQTDVVLTNTSTQVVLSDLRFTRVGTGATSNPTAPLHLTLQPGETQRISNVIGTQWGINDGVGVLSVESDSPNSVFPIIQGESYENSRPTKRFGQSMVALSEGDSAGAGQGSYLVGLRQDAQNRTTLWLFNPGTANTNFDLIYRALDGSVLGRMDNVNLAGGRMRQISPSQHELPAAGVASGFTVEVKVKSGKMLTAAQVISNASSDPAYIKGETR